MGIPMIEARISSILSLFGGIAEYPLLIKGSKSMKFGPLSWECPPDHPLLRLTVGFPNISIIIFTFITLIILGGSTNYWVLSSISIK